MASMPGRIWFLRERRRCRTRRLVQKGSAGQWQSPLGIVDAVSCWTLVLQYRPRLKQRIKIVLYLFHWYCYAFLRSFCLLARDSLELFQMDRQWQFWLEILRIFSSQRYRQTSIAWIVLLDDIGFAFFLITETRRITISWFVIRLFPYVSILFCLNDHFTLFSHVLW